MLVSILMSAAGTAQPDEPAPPQADLIHSDLPLFGDETEDKWPRAFVDPDNQDFGCTSRVAFGEWAMRPFDEAGKAGGDDQIIWYETWNYGAFHCFALVRSANERQDLEHAQSRPAFFVYLGTIGRGEQRIELWALQMGVRPGSDYTLLSRPPGQELITSFSVLQQICAKNDVRTLRGMNSLRTSYCAINDRAQLRNLARHMAALPPFGTLTLAPGAAEENEGADEPQ